jgi:SAM-dependent methyltransferase
MTRTIEVSCPALAGSGGFGIAFAPLADLLAALPVELKGARIMQLGSSGCYGISDLLEAYRPSRLVAYELGEARAALTGSRSLRARAVTPEPQPIPEPDAHFRAVFAYGLFELSEHWHELLHEVARVLRPNGVLIAQGVETGPQSAHKLTRLALALHDAGLVPAVQQRYAGRINLLIARRL